ncbi:MAG: hypothetical protein P8165_12560 [Deltaproteobacteria bacterium]
MTESPIVKRVEKAKGIFRSERARILAAPDVRRLLHRYDAAIAHTRETMRQTRVIEECTRCAEKSGSCCFQEVETWYDGISLFINLLLGAALPQQYELPGQCLFLGQEGCKLRARYAFCLNYLCPTLKGRLGPDLLRHVLAAVGHELEAGWALEQTLYRRLKGSFG